MIRRLFTKNFKKFNEKELQFNRGLNVLRGKNESGKSTIMHALLTTLFTDVNTRSKNFFDDITSWQTGSKDIYLELDISSNGDNYKLVRNFANKTQFLENQAKQIKLEDHKQILEKLENELSIPNENVFKATCFVSQAEVTNIQFDNDMKTALQRVGSVSSAGANLQENIKDLEKELKNLERGLNAPSKNPGLIKTTQDQLEETKRLLKEKQNDWEKFVKSKTEGDQASDKLTEINQKIEEKEKLLKNYKTLEEAQKQLKTVDSQLKEITSQLNSINKQQLELKQIQASMQTFQGFAKTAPDQLEKITEKLTQLRQIVKTKKATLEDLTDDLAKVRKEERLEYMQYVSSRSTEWTFGLGGAGAIFLAIIMILAGIQQNANLISYLGGIVFIGGIIFIIIALAKLYIKSKYSKVEKVEDSSQAKALEAQIKKLSTEIDSTKAQEMQLTQNFNITEPDEFFTKKAKFNTLLTEAERLRNTIKGQLGGKDLQEIETKQNELLQEKKEIETNQMTDDVKAAKLTPNDYLKVRRELDMLQIEKKRNEKTTTTSQVRAQDSDVTKEQLNEIEEREEYLEEKLERLTKRTEVISQTLQYLEQAIKNTSSTAGKQIAEEVRAFLPRLTQNNYSDFQLTQDYEVLVKHNSTGKMVKPTERLSLGTADQIYFLTRIALSKVLLQGNLKYLFLDDPFVTFDAERLEITKQILQEISQNTQIFLFTHNENYSQWGNLVEI